MRSIRYTVSVVLLIILCQATIPSYGQLGISFDLKKPKEYDDRVLRSEKSDEKKFNLPRRFIQNTLTHYNFFYNANNKLNNIIEKAKSSFKDDFSKLLPFYNYTLDATAKDKVQLDSVIYKSESGIALHDLRNDWVDNLYLLWGAAYYLKKEFDSAYLMFQFINYAFAEKEKDGYYKTIGSSRDGNQAFSIATKEKTNIVKKIFNEPPSRNDAFIWQIRNFLAQDEFTEAASLIVTLKNDPNFPDRLQSYLEEEEALWFYKQNMWDSAALHLVNALDNATNKQEKARWEFLAGQLYELSGNYTEAQKNYSAAIIHTADPVMDVYARLNSIRVNKSGGDHYIDRNIAELLKMAKREKYEDFRDIIYYMAAQMRLQQNNIDGAEALLLKSAKYSSGNIEQRNKIYLQLAEMAFTKKKYRAAYNFYDSLNLKDPTLPDVKEITKRKTMLGNLATNIEIIERQDSLQRIALMPEEDRKEFVKNLVKQLLKIQGMKDEGITNGNQFNTQQTTQSLFNNNNNGNADWYFYNSNYLIRGYNDFISKWGKRPNVDNWRRSSSLSGVANIPGQTNTDSTNQLNGGGNKTSASAITFDGLYNKLPLTPEKMKISNDSISAAMFKLGKIYAQEIEDCAATIETFENLRTRFPQFEKMDEVLFDLYYCYNKNGETTKAEQIKMQMSKKFPNSNLTTIVVTGKNPESKAANPEATKTYEKIYDLFIEGNFKEAVAAKKIADSLYGKNYWTPQLLYIEAVYYIKQKEDSVAKNVLNSIISQFPGTPLQAKAKTLLDVLSRRKQIEEELRNLVIVKPVVADSSKYRPSNNIIKNKQADTANNNLKKPVIVINKQPGDTSANKSTQQTLTSPYTFNASDQYYVMLILTKVDPIFSGEAKNAFFRHNRETYYNKIMTADLVDLNTENRILLIGSFKNAQEAIDYIANTKPLASTEIIPWLKGGKYTFSIITDKNLGLLKANQDLENYKKFLNQNLPGKF